ncbi:MAG TPA: acetate kinase [Candidatus Faecisoma merdavium]|nr:acetate kinase [Candidatus Faecisoma merdavium]
MKILSVNAGSSSLKFQMYEMPEEKVLISGVFERIGIENSMYTIKINGNKTSKNALLPTHKEAVKLLVNELIENKVINSLDEIKGIGHRIVQGADKFESSVVIDDKVIETISELSALAPLHNPAAVIGIKAFKEIIPDAVAVAVFDTSFHQTMEKETYLYALPYNWYTDYQVRKYGAHGTSHKYVADRLSKILNREDIKVIVCHLGNGGSITAINNGKCVDTSMGFTPNAGIIMGTRCGDIDVSIVPYMMQKTNLTYQELDNVINKQSGLLGISGVSSDSRDIESGIKEGNERCILAQKMFVRKVVDYIAKYYVLLNGVDAIAFTAGIGENSISTRKHIIDSLKVLGIKLDEEANNIRGEEKLITTNDSSIPCYVIPTDEEVMMARDTYKFIEG